MTCWPNPNSDGTCDVNLDFELLQDHLELQDVTMTVPLPPGTPNVASADGSFFHDKRRSVLDWTVPLVDKDNTEGSLEFRINSSDANDFFPVLVSFTSSGT